MVWRRVVPLSDVRSGARWFSDQQLEDPCGTSTDEVARLLETTMCALGSWWRGSAW
jgi:hypothetical protein